MKFANEKLFSNGYSHAAKGILFPRPYKLYPKTYIYRFVDVTKKSPELGADGPWWIEFDHFKTICHFAARNNYSFSYAARLFLAILYEWSEVNGFVRAEVQVPLKVYKGRGKTVYGTGKEVRDIYTREIGYTEQIPRNLQKMTPMQGMHEVYQLYIPGLGSSNSNFSSTLKFISFSKI